MDKDRHSKQYEIMRNIAISSSSGSELVDTAGDALKKSSKLIGLSAGMLVLWDEDYKPIFNATFAENEDENKLLHEMEEELFSSLRKNKQLISAYVTFGGEKPVSGFTLPIKIADEIIGAVIGIQPGKKPLAGEDVFLEALVATLSLSVLAGRWDALIEKTRQEAVLATSASVNHEINNSLQAILGIVQLLPKGKEDFDEETIDKLKLVEESALAIMKVTHKLMQLEKIEYVSYVDGTKMLKLPKDNNST